MLGELADEAVAPGLRTWAVREVVVGALFDCEVLYLVDQDCACALALQLYDIYVMLAHGDRGERGAKGELTDCE